MMQSYPESTSWFACLTSLILWMVPASALASSDTGGEDNVEYDTVESGQNLGSLALEHGVSVQELESWNDLRLGEAEEGMRLIVRSSEEIKEDKEEKEWLPVIHRVEKGETLGAIAEKYNVKTSSVKRWNNGVNPRLLQIGQKLRLYVPGSNGQSVSYGHASSGRLYNGVALRDSPGIDVRNIAEAYGTERVVNLLSAAAAEVVARWPRTPDLVVGDLSYKNGGSMYPHKSHQSGRDADISFYHRGNVQLGNFEVMTAETFDARKNWHFFKTLIDTGEVQFIFVNHYLQKELYEYARSIGYTKKQLEPILQYPRSKHTPVGTIRHATGHDDHSHIRFTCGPHDKYCE
jgi:LysM repeat protein